MCLLQKEYGFLCFNPLRREHDSMAKDLTLLSEVGQILIIMLMLIGGSPSSTAGMKTTIKSAWLCVCILLCTKFGEWTCSKIILGSAGFLLYFIYDINSVRKQNRYLQKFFAVGTILVVYAVHGTLACMGTVQSQVGRMIGFGIGAMCFLALLIYTLFSPFLLGNLL